MNLLSDADSSTNTMVDGEPKGRGLTIKPEKNRYINNTVSSKEPTPPESKAQDKNTNGIDQSK